MLNFEVDGVEQLNRSFSRFEEYMEDIRGVYPEFERLFYEGEERQFATQTGNGAWEQLSEPYAIWKAKNFPGMPILQLKGLLYHTMIGQTGYLRWQEDKQQLGVEISLAYALYHQRGTSRPMPAREVIYLTEETKKGFTFELQRWLVGVSQQVGLG